MNPSTSLMKRGAVAAAIALVALTVLVPAVGACCVGKTARAAASMHALMPCCGETCKLTSDTARPDHDFTLTTANPMPGVIAVAPAVERTISLVAELDIQPAAFASPPSFLSHHQFRI